MNLNLESNLFLYKGKVGDYYLSGGKKVEITKRTNKRIYLSSGIIINIKKLTDGLTYLDSKSIIKKNKSYPIIHQVLRDIEGYLIYKIHSKSFI